MEPKQTAPSGGIERPQPLGTRFTGEQGPGAPEQLPQRQHEVLQPERHETEQMPPQTLTPVVPAPPPAASPNITAVPASDATLPLTANDDEVIEKEWVDKITQIFSETKDDPHKREQRIGEAQREYVYKRYGRRIGAPEE